MKESVERLSIGNNHFVISIQLLKVAFNILGVLPLDSKILRRIPLQDLIRDSVGK